MITLLGISSVLSLINNSGTNTVDILNTRYTKSEVDTPISTSYNKTETGNRLNQKVNTSGDSVIHGSLDAYVFRCGEIKIQNDDDLHSLTLTQLAANENTIDLRTEESFANMYLKIKGTSYIGLPTTNNIAMYKYTSIDGDLTTGNTTIICDLTVTGNFTYTGDSSYTKSEMYDRLDLNMNTSLGHIYIYIYICIYIYVYIYTNLKTHGNLEASLENPLYVTNSATHTNYWTIATFHQEIANSGSWLQFSRGGTSNTWQAGMSSDNSYVFRASDATTCLSVNQHGDATTSGHLDTQRITLKKLSNDHETPLNIISNNRSWELIAMESTIAGDGCFQSFKTQQSPTVWDTGVWNQNQYGIRHGDEGHWIYDNGDTAIV